MRTRTASRPSEPAAVTFRALGTMVSVLVTERAESTVTASSQSFRLSSHRVCWFAPSELTVAGSEFGSFPFVSMASPSVIRITSQGTIHLAHSNDREPRLNP